MVRKLWETEKLSETVLTLFEEWVKLETSVYSFAIPSLRQEVFPDSELVRLQSPAEEIGLEHRKILCMASPECELLS